MHIRKTVKRTAAGMLAVIAGIFLLPSCSLPEEEIRSATLLAKPDTSEYRTVRVSSSTVSLQESLDVHLVPMRDEVLKFAASDERTMYFAEVPVKKGSSVKEGEILARLDTKELDEEIAKLQEKLAEDEKDLEVLDEMYGIEAARNEIYNASLPWAEREKAKTRAKKQYEQRRALLTDSIEFTNMRLEDAIAERDRCVITAPFDGKIVFAYTPKEGEKYRAGKKVVEIADLSLPVLRAEPQDPPVFEQGKSYTVRIGQEKAEAVCSSAAAVSLPEKSEDGKKYVYFLLTAMRQDLTSAKPYQLLYETSSSGEVLTLPAGAVYRGKEREYVYVLDSCGALVTKEVTTGMHSETLVEIVSGLAEGEEVVSE